MSATDDQAAAEPVELRTDMSALIRAELARRNTVALSRLLGDRFGARDDQDRLDDEAATRGDDEA